MSMRLYSDLILSLKPIIVWNIWTTWGVLDSETRPQNWRSLTRKPRAPLVRFSGISNAASCSSRLEILPYWSSLNLFVFSLFVSKGSAFNIKPNPLFSSFILVFSLNGRVGNGVIFIVSLCWMSGTVCTSPVCTINRLHVARRPCRPSTRSSTYAEVDLAGWGWGGYCQPCWRCKGRCSPEVKNPERGALQLHVESDVLETATKQNYSVSRKWSVKSVSPDLRAQFEVSEGSERGNMQQGSTKWPPLIIPI